MSYEQWGVDLLPEWLVGPWGRKWCTVFGGHEDVVKDANKDALKSRMPRHCPSDALPYIAADRQLERGRIESETAHRNRLQDAWDYHVRGGTADGVEAFLPWTFTVEAANTFAIAENDGWHFDNSGWWSRYWIVVQGAHGFTQETWGAGNWDSIGVWGLANTLPEDIQTLRRNAWRWTSGGCLPVLFIVVFSGQIWHPGSLWSDSPGVWGAATTTRIRLGYYWGLESHDFGAGPEASEGLWGSNSGAPADTWGVKPDGIA